MITSSLISPMNRAVNLDQTQHPPQDAVVPELFGGCAPAWGRLRGLRRRPRRPCWAAPSRPTLRPGHCDDAATRRTPASRPEAGDKKHVWSAYVPSSGGRRRTGPGDGEREMCLGVPGLVAKRFEPTPDVRARPNTTRRSITSISGGIAEASPTKHPALR